MFRIPRLLKTCARMGGAIRSSGLLGTEPAPLQTPHLSGHWRQLASQDTVKFTFEFRDGARHEVAVKEGESLLDVVLDHDVDIDGFGACEGTLACSTCHLILPPEIYQTMSMEISDEEMDMLDLAFGLEDTSRLGCQCMVNKDYEGVVIKVPAGVNDQR
ncbi:adrenodoxin-like [Pollicipes pollicipes]|uniref:adrenodoxin-like n=1 Tax=Pollicipes pollicipes TaxID=41117 RepID=UPI0018857E24|nr:adrenodoxin-like [Pollicipes pollicipes]XP_037079918.1 adrenodoxin-like [Pollicipes pollicipes]